MDNYEKIKKLPEEKYLTMFGIKKPTFEVMLKILEKEYEKMRKRGGRARKLSVLDMLVITLSYYHEYRTMANIGFDYSVHPQRVCEAIAWVEKVLIKDGKFSLPSKRKLVKDSTISITIIDVTEQETERPKYGQKASYSGKKNDIR